MVYPRVYGESVALHGLSQTLPGLSPRVRGIHYKRSAWAVWYGSIPACAGNPHGSRASSMVKWVYPRVYGESRRAALRSRPGRGLSPRVRGIPADSRSLRRAARSIPACTGNPVVDAGAASVVEVYPRVYGESVRRYEHEYRHRGLSPRVRGIRCEGLHDAERIGSIPACTGIPCRFSVLRNGQRSIPACTGNPGIGDRALAGHRVYPRVYGESRQRQPLIDAGYGLSPRVRGIPVPFRPFSQFRGSIPACTGNPARSSASAPDTGVYPRVYGESSVSVPS